MKRSEQDQLLREVLADERLEQLREASLAGMLGLARRRRRTRAFISGAAASLALVLVAFVLLQRESGLRPGLPVTRSSPSQPAIPTITDEELLALFPDRAVALVGKPGAQQLIFLQEEKSSGVLRPHP